MSGHIVYGQALFETGRLDEAHGRVRDRRWRSIPENLIALRHLGDIAARRATYAARRWYERVLEADPRNEEIQGLIAELATDDQPASAAEPAPAHDEPSAFAGLMDEPPAPEPEIASIDHFAPTPASSAPTVEMVQVTPPASHTPVPDVTPLDLDFVEGATGCRKRARHAG